MLRGKASNRITQGPSLLRASRCAAAPSSLLHSGVLDTLVQISEIFWILRGRQLIKKIIRGCQRFNARHLSEVANLKSDRFGTCSSNRTGLRRSSIRSDGCAKMYVCLFMCAVIRAVHLELVQNMTATSFLDAFRRFVSRRGLPSVQTTH